MKHLRWFLTLALLSGLAACSGGNDDDDDSTPVTNDDDDDTTPSEDDTANDDDDTVPELDDFVEPPLIRYVNPFIGTGGVGFGVGSTYPGPAMPFGMIHPGPDTVNLVTRPGFNHCSGYYYLDDKILGFSHTRMNGTGVPDYGNLAVMPMTFLDEAIAADYRSPYRHEMEEAAPGYYSVLLDKDNIRVELTAGYWSAIHRITFPDEEPAQILFDPTHAAATDGWFEDATVRVDEDGTIHSYTHYHGGMSGRDGGLRTWMAARVDRAITGSTAWDGAGLASANSIQGTNVRLAVTLADGSQPVILRVAISFISEANAVANLDAEAGDMDFESMRERAEEEWEKRLALIEIAGGTERERTIFYSALYRSFLMPTLFTESDGRYRGMDKEVHEVAEGFTYYTDFSLWDTFHSLHPLMILIDPGTSRDFAESLVQMYKDGGSLDRWPLGDNYTGTMIGAPQDNVFAETWLKGVTGWDVETAYAASREQAMGPLPPGSRGPGRGGIENYITLGYIPNEVSVNLEYACNDFALSNLAAALGHQEDATMFAQRSKSYANIFDPSVGFMRARDAEGHFVEDFNSVAFDEPYTEGNAWQWTFYVPHDAAGLAGLYGSHEAMATKLETLFSESSLVKPFVGSPPNFAPDNYYWHGNEPCIHMSYMFNDVSRPDRTQHWVREVMNQKYGDGPDGLPGNDDGGTMSAWYIFSSLGFFPVVGGTEYWTGSPIFTRALIHREEGDIEIQARGASDTRRFVSEVRINETPLSGARFDHSDIRAGALIEFDMTE